MWRPGARETDTMDDVCRFLMVLLSLYGRARRPRAIRQQDRGLLVPDRSIHWRRRARHPAPDLLALLAKSMRDWRFIANDEPVEWLFTRGMVIKDGAKMSKSLGNSSHPTRWSRATADAARLYSLFAAPPDRDLDWQDSGIEGIQRFLGRVYRFFVRNAARNRLRLISFSADLCPKRARSSASCIETIKRVSDDFQGLGISTLAFPRLWNW